MANIDWFSSVSFRYTLACLGLASCAILLSGCGDGNGSAPSSSTAYETPAPSSSNGDDTDAPIPPSSAGSSDPCTDSLSAAGTTLNQHRVNVCKLVNEARATSGLPALKLDATLSAVAQAYTSRMSKEGFFSHTSPDGSTPGTRLTAAGVSWRTYGENIAMGQSTPTAVMSSWMNSSGHRANILNSRFGRLGVGFDNKYWTQVFTN